MNNEKNIINFDLEIKNLLKNVEEMKANIDLFEMIIEEQIPACV